MFKMLHAHLLSACKYSGDQSATCRLDPHYCHSGHLSPVNYLSVLNWIPARGRYLPLPAPNCPPPSPDSFIDSPLIIFSLNSSQSTSNGVCWTVQSERGVCGGELQRERKSENQEEVVWSRSSQLAAAPTKPEAALNGGRGWKRAAECLIMFGAIEALRRVEIPAVSR